MSTTLLTEKPKDRTDLLRSQGDWLKEFISAVSGSNLCTPNLKCDVIYSKYQEELFKGQLLLIVLSEQDRKSKYILKLCRKSYCPCI